MRIASTHALLLHEMSDLYDAEHQILKALPRMAKKASSPDLKRAFEEHRKQTEQQTRRLERAFEELGAKPKRHKCPGMKGLLEEGKELLTVNAPAEVRDSALIGAAQKVEHYEIAGYGTAAELAREMGHETVENLLRETLEEEGQTDKKLTMLAETMINPLALEKAPGM